MGRRRSGSGLVGHRRHSSGEQLTTTETGVDSTAARGSQGMEETETETETETGKSVSVGKDREEQQIRPGHHWFYRNHVCLVTPLK